MRYLYNYENYYFDFDKHFKKITYFCFYLVLDASGTPGSGFLFGNNFWLGSNVFCNELQNRAPLKLNLRKVPHPKHTNYTYPPYQLSFVISFIRHNSSLLQRTQEPLEVSYLIISRCSKLPEKKFILLTSDISNKNLV